MEWAHIDGAFVAGTHGQTKPAGGPVTDWTLVEVLAGRRAVIEIVVPGAAVRFEWEFSDGERGGAVLRQAVELAGEEAESYLDAMQSLTDGMPAGMARLAAAIDRAATGPPN